MAFRLLTAEEYAAQNLNFLESALGQSAPLQEKAFLRVLAVMQAMGQTGLAKYAANRALQSLALTATGADLDNIGAEFGVDRTLAVSAVVTATITGTTGLTLPAGRLFTGAVNGVSYYVDASVVLSGGVATFTATAGTPGVTGNLQATDILNIVQPIAGIASYATVTALTTTGAEEETDDAYRLRILERQ